MPLPLIFSASIEEGLSKEASFSSGNEIDHSGDYALYVRGISKTFSNGIVANNDVTFGIIKGEVHALLGENGAGKTTLMKILSGCLKPDRGEIYVNGVKTRISDPRKAVQLGIGMVHQHFTLIPTFTVAENIALVSSSSTKLKLETVEEKIREVSKSLNFEINPDTRIEELPVGARQKVEILRLLCQDVSILILDEPTSVLTPLEVEDFFRIIRQLKNDGKSVIIITHKVKEALSISDRITIMRGGKTILTIPSSQTNASELASYVVEGFVPSLNRVPTARGEPTLSVRGLFIKGDRGEMAVKGLDLSVHSGEIVGLAGVTGNGQKELVEALAGLRKVESGSISLKTCELTNKPPNFVIKNGVSYIPEDRMRRGVVLGMTISENLALKRIDKEPYSKKMLIDKGSLDKSAKELISVFGIKASDPCAMAGSLSGGNIQKLIVARELTNGPNVVIAEQPTAGLDVKASEAVHQKLLDLKSKGAAVLLISADLDEIMKLSDRVLIIFGGKIVGEFSSDTLDMEKLSKLMLGSE